MVWVLYPSLGGFGRHRAIGIVIYNNIGKGG